MSIHSSLRGSAKGKKHRSVLKRYERLGVLKEKNSWDEEKSVFGIPKVKQQKLKVRKEKAVAPETAGAPGTAAPTAGATVSAGKAAPASKPAAKTDKK